MTGKTQGALPWFPHKPLCKVYARIRYSQSDTEFWFVMLYRYGWCNTDNYLLQLKSHYFCDKIESAAPLKESSISSEAVK